jgi:uncharacterized membrane protein (DUF373 family)
MTIEAAIVSHAREIAEEIGDTSDEAVIEILARMVAVATCGMSCGFVRTPPRHEVWIKPKPRSLEE